jgi:hypothetical protein
MGDAETLARAFGLGQPSGQGQRLAQRRIGFIQGIDAQ